MDSFVRIEKPTEHQPEEHSASELGFEEELRRQNISTMLEIYKEEYLKKIGMLAR
jgi:hypothetical protein